MISVQARAVLSRMLRLGRRVGGYLPFSAPGLGLALTIGAGLYFFGMKHSDHILLIAGVCVLLLALVDMLFVIGTALFIGWKFRQYTQESRTRHRRLDFVTGIPAPSSRLMSRYMPPLIEASTHILNPPSFDCEWRRDLKGRREEWLLAGRRCELEENFCLRRRVIVKDVLGFCALDWEQEEPLSLRVLPKPLPLESQNLVSSWFQGDDVSDPRGEPTGDRVDMRPYAPGDPPRLLLWKIYARTGKLMVRVPERAVTTAPRVCAYLVAGPGDEAVASLARTIVEKDLLGKGWCFGADGSSGVVGTSDEALRLIARSGNPDTVSGQQLDTFLQEAAQKGFSSCVLMVPSQDGEWVDTVAKYIAKAPLAINLLTVGSVSPRGEEPKWRELVFYQDSQSVNPNELFVRLSSSAVSDWLTFDPNSQQVVVLRRRNSGSEVL